MSAKKKSPPAKAVPAPLSSDPAPATAGAATLTAPEPTTSWLESSDPRKRLVGKIALVGVWIYVAALWLLALDQWFNWGIFGPKIPPLP